MRAALTRRAAQSSPASPRCVQCLQRRRHSTYNHFITQNERSPEPGAIRLAVKDNIATFNLPTSCASSILAEHPSPYEATIVQQLREHVNAHVVGKTNMDEFGMGSHSLNSAHGPVRNPAGQDLSTGGSSGGSAVAVQVDDADIALGTDTGGSVRLPAAWIGCVGYKPSYGMLSRYGVVPYANSLDTVGLLARATTPIRASIFDSSIYQLTDPKDPTCLSLKTRQRCIKVTPVTLPDLSDVTIGLPLEYNIAELDPSIRSAWSQTAELLAANGATVVPVSLPTTPEALCAYYVLAPAEASSNLAKYDGVRYGVRSTTSDAAGDTLYSETRGVGFGDEVKRRILLGTYTLSSDAIDNYFLQAQRVRRLVQRDFDRVFRLASPLHEPVQFDLSDMPDTTDLQDKTGPAQVDFLLCPTAPTCPPRVEDVKTRGSVASYVNDVFTVPASLAGLPAVSVPVRSQDQGTAKHGVPASMQIIGQYWDDRRMLALAELMERLGV
ncbi:uncharacterized protein J7T54_003056 [Emericellopsis cladophorae]|uniref:Glutamyl-tRNA(Gln) amidotransferase subunit A, mitochondrial n=1 Tax=Emericellopsis cladophorae TaxID=2686198 RepID=A0A9P9Y0M4_9HYPO|nr:uncharacterized protein J7T54_003056 [Emericellopsis cladophorae]KAI6780915.1 hypothetical protein J7T54_003056 [Emericellopsis cladophorae]